MSCFFLFFSLFSLFAVFQGKNGGIKAHNKLIFHFLYKLLVLAAFWIHGSTCMVVLVVVVDMKKNIWVKD